MSKLNKPIVTRGPRGPYGPRKPKAAKPGPTIYTEVLKILEQGRKQVKQEILASRMKLTEYDRAIKHLSGK